MAKYLMPLTALIVASYCYVDPKDYGPALAKEAAIVHQECRIISGATEEEILQTRKGDFSGGINIKRYNACLWLHLQVANTSLHSNLEKLKSLEPPHLKGKVAHIYANCAEKIRLTEEKDFVEMAWKSSKCSHDVDPENYIFP
ncbi:unnamed protein product [Phyllotreta striolata]|uniref:Uncharacterized protein n=1 Tax=Phyllotreta striolata TaxID=444603 RepID=A0A9N9TTE6_PHYSR|nr:unnamed protein product [Phyllotreta striolata]